MIGWTQTQAMDANTAANEQQVFVARETQISQLEARLKQAIGGKGQIIFVSGKAGAGKTALLNAFFAHVKRTYLEVFVSLTQCPRASEYGDVFRSFDDLLADLEEQTRSHGLTRMASSTMAEVPSDDFRTTLRTNLASYFSDEDLRTLCFDLGIDYDDLPGQERTGKAREVIVYLEHRGRLHELIVLCQRLRPHVVWSERNQYNRVTQIADQSNPFRTRTTKLAWYAARYPLLLAIDDFHLADDRTSVLLQDLVGTIASLSVLLVVAFRPEEIRYDHAFYTARSEMTTRRGVEEIQLDELTEAESEQRRFVNAYLDAAYGPNRFDTGFRHAIAERTDGLPFFVEELLKLYEQQRWIRQVDGYWSQVAQPDRRLPKRPQDFIKQERWVRLQDKDQTRLQVASVEGEEFTLQVVADAIEEDAGQVCDRLDGELGQRQKWVRPGGSIYFSGHTYPRYGFWHSFYHEVAYELLSDAAKKRWHGRVGTAKKTIWGAAWKDIAAELAEHFKRAENWDEALACYEHMRHELQGLARPGQRAQIALKCAKILRKLKQPEAALQHYQEAETLALQADDLTQRRTALMGQAWTLFETEDYIEAERFFHEVISFEASLETSSNTEHWPEPGRGLYFGLAVAQLANERQEDAMIALAEALKPENPDINDRLSESDLQDARRWLQRLQEQRPDTPGIAEALRLVFCALGEATC